MKRYVYLLLIIFICLPTFVGCDLVRNLCPHSSDNLITIAGKASTCAESGLTEGKKCGLCSEIVVSQEEIPPLGHIYEYFTEKDEEGNRINVEVCQRETCGERKNVTDKERLIGEWKNAAGITDGDLEITIRVYLASFGDSGQAALKMKVSQGEIYFFDYLYSKVEYVTDPGIDFSFTKYDVYGEKVINGERVFDTIEKIKKCEGCYMITRETDSGEKKKAVYELDGYFYFFTLSSIDTSNIEITHFTNFKDGLI